MGIHVRFLLDRRVIFIYGRGMAIPWERMIDALCFVCMRLGDPFREISWLCPGTTRCLQRMTSCLVLSRYDADSGQGILYAVGKSSNVSLGVITQNFGLGALVHK